MHHTVSKYPSQFQTAINKNPPMGRGVKESEVDQLSPVNLTTSAATPLSLPPLQWCHYDSKPDTVYARNSGFTVAIQASYNGDTPNLRSGPLTDQYNFSQVHFHWGEHDETGSGHSVDGVRYPLEMHVIHIKKEYSNFYEAMGAKDGVAIAVHLFSLTEERNTQLDQLIAVLQFIQKPNCCAKLYPGSLSEIVNPFTKDYFLYWGTVKGPSHKHSHIVWLVSRNVLTVSSQQLEQFRKLNDERGNFIWSNANDPHPLGDRSLFFVSPSKKSNESMFAISPKPTKNVVTFGSDRSIGIHDAEFKSLVALEDAEVGSCAICPHPNHAGHQTTKNSTHAVRITEGDTSIEESCADLGALQEPKTLIKPKNDQDEEGTTAVKSVVFGNTFSPKDTPSHESFSEVSAYEDIHVKQKPPFIRKSDPSTEQACIFLNKTPSVRSARSAPSLATCWGHLAVKKECTDISNSPKTSKSSEILVFNFNMESSDTKRCIIENDNLIFSDKQKSKTKTAIYSTKCKFKDVATQKSCSQAKYSSSAGLKGCSDKKELEYNSKSKASGTVELFDNESPAEYLLVKLSEPKKSLYKVIGELVMTPDNNRTFVKCARDSNKTLLSEVRDKVGEAKNHYPKQDESTKANNVDYENRTISFPLPREERTENQNIENPNHRQNECINQTNKSKKSWSSLNSPNKVNIRMQPQITDHKSIHEKIEDMPMEYYVTRITPVVKSQQVHPEERKENRLYYAQPVRVKQDVTPKNPCQLGKNPTNLKFKTSYISQSQEKPDGIHQYKEHITGCNENLPRTRNIVAGSDSVDTRFTHNLENYKPSDHLLSWKQVRDFSPHKNADSAITTSSSENKTTMKNYLDNMSSLHRNLKISSQDLKFSLDPNISIKILQGQSSQDKNNNQTSNSNHKKKIKLAISIKSHGETSNSNYIQKMENLTPEEPKINNNAKPIQFITQVQRVVEHTPVTGSKQHLSPANLPKDSNNEIVLEEEFEESTVYSTQKSKKKVTIQVTSPVYKIPSQPPVETRQSSSQHLIRIKKVEIPDPYYLSRVPRQPIVEYEAFHTGHPQQVKTIETEETSSEVKTKRTTSLKKGNTVRKVLAPNNEITKDIVINKEKYSTNRVNDSTNDHPFENNEAENTEITENRLKIEDNEENLQQIMTDDYQLAIPLTDESSLPQHHGERDKNLKNIRIVIASYQPKTVTNDENKPVEKIVRQDENNKPNTIKNNEDKTVVARDQNTEKEMHEHVMIVEKLKLERSFVDAATSNPSYSLTSTSQQSQELKNADIQENPTKDPGFGDFGKVGQNQTNSETLSIKTQVSKISLSSMQSNNNQSSSSDEDKARKDTLIYIHQPQSDDTISSSSLNQLDFDEIASAPAPVQDVSSAKTSKNQATESEKLVSKASKTPSILRKAVSTNTYEPSTKSAELVSDISQEELISSHIYESNEMEDKNSSHCNITFKSETKMELPSGQTALMTTMAEVKFPIRNPSQPEKSIWNGAKTSEKETKDQATVTIKDECCSAIDLKKHIDNSKRDTSVNISTSTEDKGKEYTAINYSPVRIEKNNTSIKILPSLQFKLHWNRPVSGDAILENNGKLVRATLVKDVDLPILAGGPLEGEYVFAELHFHWGRKDCCGAEHIVDGQRHTMEAHFLYFKKEYESVNESLNHTDGLAMVAIQLKAGGPPHPLFEQLIQDIAVIREAGYAVFVPADSLFSWIKQTVEEAPGYFSYKGTLTSGPPLVEAVTWIIFQQPVIFCCQQSIGFRKLMSPNGEFLLKTYRASQPLNDRPIFYVPFM